MNKLSHKNVELDIKELNNEGEFEGYASKFGIVDQGGDVVEPGAFSKTLAEHETRGSMPKMLWQHNPNKPIGVFTNMKEDDTGLYVKGKILTEVPDGAATLALLRNNAIDGMSIGYRTVDADYQRRGDGSQVRRLKELALWEVSVVTFPMQMEAQVTGVKSDLLKSEEDFVEFLVDAGFTEEKALAICANGFKTEDQDAQHVLASKFETEMRGLFNA